MVPQEYGTDRGRTKSSSVPLLFPAPTVFVSFTVRSCFLCPPPAFSSRQEIRLLSCRGLASGLDGLT